MCGTGTVGPYFGLALCVEMAIRVPRPGLEAPNQLARHLDLVVVVVTWACFPYSSYFRHALAAVRCMDPRSSLRLQPSFRSFLFL